MPKSPKKGACGPMTKPGPHPDYLQLVDAAETADAGEHCGVLTRRGTACRRSAGWGTEHAGRGPCRDHAAGTRSMPCPLPLTRLEEEIWNDVSIRLRELRLFKPAFWPTLYGLVVALAMLHNAYAELDALAVPGRGASVKKHPAAIIVNQMLAQVRQYLQELGLTPSALAKVGGPPTDEPTTKMGRLIRGRGR